MKKSMQEFIGITLVIIALFLVVAGISSLNKSDIDPETDLSKYSSPSLANDFFQGSAGGGWTCYTLQTTMLQPDYDGEWIDGVRFLYNGEENKYFRHIEGLDRIKYR